MRFKIYARYWWASASLSVQTALENRTAAIFFLLGKFLRFFLFLAFLQILHRQIDNINGYDISQMTTFFLVFNLFDLFGQIFFRGIYWFRNQVISGEFDFRITKPLSSLFQALTRQTDVLDIPLLCTVVVLLLRQNITLSLYQVGILILIVITSLLIITSVHIIVAGLGVITTEVDHTIMIYRDLSNMARFPIDIYSDSIRALLTFIIPVGIAYTFPAKALLGLLDGPIVIISPLISIAIFLLSLQFWKYAVRQYSSASS